MNEQLDMKIRFHTADALNAEFDRIIKESDMGSLVNIKQISMGYLEASHIKIAGFYFVLQIALFLRLFFRRVCTC